MYLYTPYRCKVEKPDALQLNVITNFLQWKCACGSMEFYYEYSEAASLEDGSGTLE